MHLSGHLSLLCLEQSKIASNLFCVLTSETSNLGASLRARCRKNCVAVRMSLLAWFDHHEKRFSYITNLNSKFLLACKKQLAFC